MFKRTTAVNKILALNKRIKVVQGGTSSGKTYAIIPILINRALSENRLKITVVAETLPSVKEGAMDIFMSVMQDTGRWIDSCWNASSLTYTFKSTKSRIQFKSFDSEGKAKASGKRDILFLNEANHIDWKIADALMIRSIETYIDYNPDVEFWVHTELLQQDNVDYIILTFEDNEGLPPETLEDLLIKREKAFIDSTISPPELFNEKNIKNEYWANWWRVYGLGITGKISGVIFQDWKEVQTIPNNARLICNGVDFGFSISKFASVNIWQLDQHYYLEELVYETNLTNPEAAQRMKDNGYVNSTIAYCDYAEPKSIKELKDAGIRAVECESKTDIKMFAIKKLNEKTFFIKGENLKKELQLWKWDEKTGKPQKNANDHLMDAICYAIGSEGKFDGRYN